MKPIERQYRQLAFLQVLFGLLAFCIAEGRPVLLGVVGALAVASWFLTEGKRKIGLDRNLLNLGAVGTVVLLTAEALLTGGSQPVALVGHFTMALQLVLLFAIKTRREYVQLAVLSPLQMIGASVLPGGVTLLFGVLLMVYCCITLLTVLSFQLKSAGDLVHQRYLRGAAQSEKPEHPDQVVGPYIRLHFRSSALAIGVICGLIAGGVFIAVPRAQQDPFAAAMVNARPVTQNQTGFNERVVLGQGSIAGGSPEPVMNVTVSQDGLPLGSANQSWLIRGAVQDTYDPVNVVWSRPPLTGMNDLSLEMPGNGLRLAVSRQPTREATITLRRRSISSLFTVVSPDGPVAPTYIDAPSLNRLTFSPEDQQLSSNESLASVLRYDLNWCYSPETDLRGKYRQRLDDLNTRWRQQTRRFRYRERLGRDNDLPPTLDWPVETERVRTMTQRLLRKRDLPIEYQDADPQQRMEAVRALTEYLRRNYRYTLNSPKDAETDPVIAFLFKTRAGHCELFASGLAAMCRSVGIPARLATGYRASEYNSIGGYYVVRESHAHAWTEADLGEGAGWHVYDATPADRNQQNNQANTGLLAKARALYDHLEFNWIATIITYDQNTQKHLLGAFGSFLNQGPDRWFADATEWVSDRARHVAFDTVGRALGIIIVLALGVAVLSLVRLFVVRHRRMVALQLTALPRAQQRRLSRQLRFYIIMLELLERHGWTRPHWQSPFQFARTLADQHPLQLEPVISLTEMFYEVRFGYRALDSERLARVRLHLRRLEQNLAIVTRK